jgi:DNA-binding phage protein
MAKRKLKQITINRSEIFSDLISILDAEGVDLNRLAEDASVSLQTLRNWLWGTTFNPHINTMLKVADALGYDIALRRRAGTRLRIVK